MTTIPEMIAADGGIAFLSWNSRQVLTVDTMYAKLFVIAVFGFIFSAKLDEIERQLNP